MIEVNLLPGGRKRKRSKRSLSFSLPSIGGFAGADRWVVGAGTLVVVSLLSIGWLFLSVAGEAEELEVSIEEAVRDSARLAEVIERAEGLQARRDSIAQRVDIIQQIDGNRYVWPHILDEVARALSDYTWLDRLEQVTTGDPLVVRIEGRAGTIFALTSFMEALEASAFLRRTELISTDQLTASQENGRRVYEFTLEAEYTEPPIDLVETEPLFDGTVQPPVAQGG